MSSAWSVAVEGYRSALPAILLSAAGGLVAGALLGGMEASLAAIDGLVVLVPAFLAVRGSVYGSLGSRLSRALHQGLIAPRLTRSVDGRVASAVVAAFLNGLVASLVAAVATYGLLLALGAGVAPLWALVLVAGLGAVMAGVALTVVVVVVVFVGYRNGVDPDNVVGPAVTTTGDVLGVGSLFLAAELVRGLL